MQPKMEIRGEAELLKRFARLNEEWGKEKKKATEEAGDYVLEHLPKYPPAPPFSSYRRTGTLGKELNRKAQVIGTQIVGTIGSPTQYSPWVISSHKVKGIGPQTLWHTITGWWLLQDEIRRMSREIKSVYKKALSRMKRNSG